MSEYSLPEPERHLLSLDKVGLSMALPSGVHRPRLSVDNDYMRDQMTARLTAYVLSEHLADDTEEASTRVPLGWWDHAKLDLSEWSAGRWFDRPIAWWVKRRPVKYRTITLAVTWSRAATRPQSRIALPDSQLGPVVYQERTSRSLWD